MTVESRTAADRGIYPVGPCDCQRHPRKHEVFNLVVSTGYDPEAGRYRQVWRRHHGTPTTARNERRRMLDEHERGDLRPAPTRHTLNELFEAWLADLARLKHAPVTVKNYRRDAARYWSHLGDRPLHRIARADIRAVTNRLVDEGVGVHHALSTVSAAFSWAVQEGWISAHEDPSKKIRRPSQPSKLPQVPNPEQVRAVIAEARAAGLEQMARFLFLGAVTGCRPGELRGLRVRDVDLSTGVIGLVTAMSAEVEWTLKNRQERPVGLDEMTVAVVQAQIAYLEQRAREMGVTLRQDAFLFCDDPTGATHWRGVNVSRLASTLFDHAGRVDPPPCSHREGETCPHEGPLAHFTFKHLRKFMSTWAHELGFDSNAVAQRGGHEKEIMERHYVGARRKTDLEISAGLAGLLADKAEP